MRLVTVKHGKGRCTDQAVVLTTLGCSSDLVMFDSYTAAEKYRGSDTTLMATWALQCG